MWCRWVTAFAVQLSLVKGAATTAFENADYTKGAPAQQSGDPWPSLSSEKSTYVRIHKDEPLGQPTEFYFGSNVPVYVQSEFFNSDDTFVKMATSGQSFLRYPGGSAANKLLWDADYETYPYFASYSWMTADSKYLLEDFVKTINETGATPLVELNAALALVYGYDVAADYFISMHQQLLSYGVEVSYYEFGNENYGGWEPPYGDYPVNGTVYGEAFLVATRAMKKAYPKIQMGFVGRYDYAGATPSDETQLLDVIISGWMADVLAVDEVAKAADFVIIHEYYFKSTSDAPTNAELFGEVALLTDMRAGVENFFAEADPDAEVPPIILSEFSLVQVSSSGCGATLQFISTLWHAEMLGEAVAGDDVAALMMFSWADAAVNCTYTKRGDRGDYGMVSYGNDVVTDGTPTPQFYAYAVFHLAFGDIMVNSTISEGTSTKLKTYASTFAGGEIGVVIVNEDSEARTLRLDGLTSSGAITVNGWIVTSSDPDANDPLSETGVMWNGNPPDTFPLETAYAPYTTFAAKGSILEVDVPAYSVTGLVAYY